MGDLNFQHAWKKHTVFAPSFLRDQTPFYLALPAVPASWA